MGPLPELTEQVPTDCDSQLAFTENHLKNRGRRKVFDTESVRQGNCSTISDVVRLSFVGQLPCRTTSVSDNFRVGQLPCRTPSCVSLRR